jgi:lipopolysaccharide export system protein LptA
MKRPALLFAALLALVSPVLAAENPVEISADQFVVDEGKREAVFTGNVVMKRADLTVWAAKVVVLYGSGGLENIETLTATGGVRLKNSDQDATGDRAVFSPDTQVLRLSGNVTVVNSAGTLNGPELVINLAEKTSVFSAAGGGRVTGVFTSAPTQ